MAWSSRQVWGFTAVMLGIVVLSIVAMITVALVLTMGSPPEGHLIIAPSTAQPATEALVSDTASCQATPENAFIFLPDHCAIITPSPSSSSSSSPSSPSSHLVEFLPYFNMRRCPNHMCHPNSCLGNRCCCQAIELSSLTYHCPNERAVLVPNIIEKCGCAPCIDMSVVFVGMVTDTDNIPIPRAIVLVDDSEIFYANEEAIFGFSITSAHSTVVVMVTAVGYWEYRQVLPVLPGEINVLTVQLMKQLRQTLRPSLDPVLVNLLDLSVVTAHDPSLPLGGGGAGAESFIEFPEGMLTEMTTLIGQSVDISNEGNLQSLGMSFVSVVPDRRRRGMDWRLREGEEGEGREEVVVYVVSVGVLDVMGEDGVRLEGGVSGLLVHTYLSSTNHTCYDPIPFQFYLLTDMGLRPVPGNISCSTAGGGTHLVVTLPSNTPLPLTFLLGTPQGDTCYVAARTFEPTSMGNTIEMVSTVWLHTEGVDGMVNVMIANTNTCVPVPCQGNMSVRILDGLQYAPDSYTIFLSDDIIITSDDVIVEGQVYHRRSDCEQFALGHESDDTTYFQFVVSPRTPTLMVSPTPEDAATPPYCSLRVGVVIPVGVASVQVKASSETSDVGVKMVRVGRVGSGDGGEDGDGSAVCPECHESHVLCLEVSCDYQIEVGVSGVGGEEVVCVPMVMRGEGGGGEGVVMEEGIVRIAEGAQLKGLVVDLVSSDPSVAMEMCKLSDDTDVWFRCIT